MEAETLNNDAIIGRIKYLIDSHMVSPSQAELARRMGMDPSNLSKHLTGKLPVSRALINRLVVDLGVSKQWLLEGEGVPFPRSEHAVEVASQELIPVDVERMGERRQGVPVYDIDVTAGSSPLERLMTIDRVRGYIDLPRINPECVVVRVTGDSMEPRILDGGYVAIRPIKSTTNIFWGQIYVIVMEEYRMVKYLRRHPTDASLVVLHSANPEYDDMDVSRSDIQALFLVETVLNFKNLC